MTICAFFQQGRCKFGDRCKFEHPGRNTNGSSGNRFGALAAGGFGNQGSRQTQQSTDYNLNASDIKLDLTVGKGRPEWIFSAYAPLRDLPRQLFGGPQREQSMEEMRLRHYQAAAAGNMNQAMQEAEALYAESAKQMELALSDINGAIQYITDGAKEHPNRIDIVNGNTDSNANQVSPAFGQSSTPAPTNAFGGSSSSTTFGQPSAFGGNSSSTAFGQPSTLGGNSSSTAFGQPSTLGGNSSSQAFGQPSAFGQTASLGQPSAFGQPSSLGQKPSPFGQPSAMGGQGAFGKPAFGQPAQPGNTQPAFGQSGFGQPSGPAPFGGAAASPFGTVNQNANPSAFGQPPAQQPATAANPSPFGQVATQQAAAPSGFGQPSGTSGFGQPSQNPTPFGQPQQANPNPFGQPPAAANPFGAPQAAPAPFGQPAAPQGLPVANVDAGPPAFMQIDDPNELNPLPRLQGETRRDPGSNRLTAWKGRPVRYVNNYPCYEHPQDPKTLVRINFPDGPPDAATLRDSQGKEDEYTPEVIEMYQFFLANGYFKDGIIPAVPPKREWISFDF
ncbi:uncharacterized protein N7503_007073 [Penicillium pulvis]|uniref:uncharacterized protein n=1 Tax=Penicillium pulvis TaxID=1562058 RepID=UPI0025493207|nr:uncharacterized protein N7503_007073 [Penicillium pulvis]KAJ5797777.1 hypothetical protein N7503_007073 [Penicillium pulvis]